MTPSCISPELSHIPTHDLVNELAKRKGVQEFSLPRSNELVASRLIPGPDPNSRGTIETLVWGVFGPARILVVMQV